MTTSKLAKFWFFLALALVAVTLLSSLMIWSRRDTGQALEIKLPAPVVTTGQIYIDGASDVPPSQSKPVSQKVNINRAEAWLLQALPDIGPIRAQAILTYRLKNGPFQNIQELTKVQGIGPATFEKIRDLITVSD